MPPRLGALPIATALLLASTPGNAHNPAAPIFQDSFDTGDLWGWTVQRGGSENIGACPVELEERGQRHFVDPGAGSDTTGDGTAANPWRSLQFVVDERVACVDQSGVPHHADAPVEGGDTIVLLGTTGHSVALEISGCYNADYVTITGETLHEPALSSVHFRGGGHWRLSGLHIENDRGGSLVRLDDHSTHGPVSHIDLWNNRLTSGDLTTMDDYTHRASDGFRILSQGPSRLRCNELSKVAQAMSIAGSHKDVIKNTVEYFTRDAIATGGHYNRFLGNQVYDSISLGDGHHDDFFQSHMGANPDVSSHITIAYNRFIQRYSNQQPALSWAPTQCLSAFEDGNKTDIRIYNNICKTDHFHGITWKDTNNSLFINNTVVGGSDYRGLPPGSASWPSRSWISVSGSGNVVRNNLVTRNSTGGDHNIEVEPTELDLYFNNWDDEDLSLATGSPAIDAGDAAAAPETDIDHRPRQGSPDVGAYESNGD